MKIPQPYVRKRARIEIIPLIDIIFFLLATFVMVSLSMVKNQGITINLPVAATGVPVERTEARTITVTKAGDVYLDKEMISLTNLTARLKAFKSQHKDVQVLINGDDGADFGIVVTVLDEVRNLGITKVSIQTKKAKGEVK